MASSDFARQLLYSAGFEDIQAVQLNALQGFSQSLPGGCCIPVTSPGLPRMTEAGPGLKQKDHTGKPCIFNRNMCSPHFSSSHGQEGTMVGDVVYHTSE